jgi:hypothetical protein
MEIGMAGGNPFMPPGSSLPANMPGANPGGPVGQGPGMDTDSQDQPVHGAPMPNQAGPGPAGQAGAPQQPMSLEQVGRMMHNQYKDGMKAQEVLDHLRTELDQLLDYGDMVRPEQVIEAAGRLVGHGIGATQLAQIMSDMPAIGGEGLASWVRMHDVTVTNAEQALIQQNNLVGHRLGMVGMRMLAQQHVMDRIGLHMQAARDAAQTMGPLGPGGSGGAQGSTNSASMPGPSNALGGSEMSGDGDGNA